MGAWGPCIFQNDRDLDDVCDLNDIAKLHKVKEKILANKERYCFPTNTEGQASEDTSEEDSLGIHLSVYNPSHPDLVQEHLNDGVLLYMIEAYQSENDGCRLCLVIACAMELGCNLPDWFKPDMLFESRRSKHPNAEDIAAQLSKYRNGVPLSFQSKGLLDTANTGNPFYKESEILYQDLEDVPAGEELTPRNTTIERVYGDFNWPIDVCGNCRGLQCQDGSKLKRSAGCKKRHYCSRECQMNHFPQHAINCSAVHKFRAAQQAEKKTDVPKSTEKPGSVRILNW